ncbi:glycosyltransferase [archaeon]|nr:glycosyltransferase [archaeon]
MKNKPFVSIIIPVYNSEKTLKKCIQSVLNQNYGYYELIIVDNNSTDNSKKIMKEFQKNNKVIYLFEKIQSIGMARNTGEKKAKGEIILMTDADCVVPENWISEMIHPILKNSYDAVQGSQKSATNDFWSKHIQLRSPIVSTPNHSKALGILDTKNFAIKMKALKAIGHSNTKYPVGNDTALAIQIDMKKMRFFFNKNVKVIHFHPDSFNSIVKRNYNYGYWCSRITKNYKGYLQKTSFPDMTNQTWQSFFRFFPGLIKNLFVKGPGYAYFDLVEGTAWRMGLISGMLGFKQ